MIKDIKIEIPPILGIGSRWVFLLSGKSRTPYFMPILLITGVTKIEIISELMKTASIVVMILFAFLGNLRSNSDVSIIIYSVLISPQRN